MLKRVAENIKKYIYQINQIKRTCLKHRLQTYQKVISVVKILDLCLCSYSYCLHYELLEQCMKNPTKRPCAL